MIVKIKFTIIKKIIGRILKKIEANTPLDKIGSESTHLKGNKYLIKGQHARYLAESLDDGKKVNILGITNHDNKQHFKELMNKLHDAGLQYTH